MQKHLSVYRKFFGLGDQDQFPACEMGCDRQSNDIHHIHSRGLKGFDYDLKWYDINHILNLIGLCRVCHEKAHGGGLSKEELIEKHKYVLLQHNSKEAYSLINNVNHE